MTSEFKHQSVGTKLTQTEWESTDLHQIDGTGVMNLIVTSKPPSGMCRIVNIYYNPQTEKAIFQYEDTPA